MDTVIKEVDWGIMLSFGKVNRIGNSLILTDLLTHSRMVVDSCNGKLKIKNSFHFCENMTSDLLLEETGSFTSEFSDFTKGKSHKSFILTRYKYNATTVIKELPYGTYNSPTMVLKHLYMRGYYMDSRPGFHLVLADPHHYKLSMGDILISKGIFTRNKNILLLYDTSMDHVYHLLIESNGLKSMLMPGDTEGVTLRQGHIPIQEYSY
ncbi:MAG TPA: hypothetical protein VK212_02765 [Lentimicrobium sp.]|nr:hypothetical protein [Lentimicrobium sp.]